MKRGRRRLGALLGMFLFAASLSAQKVETVGGVRVVHNEKGGQWGKNPKVSLQFIRAWGDTEAEDANVAFYLPADIAKDAAGNLYILDSGNHRIQKFSGDGKYIATFGRQGQGPGEFSFPSSLELDSRGYLYVSDPNNQRIQVLTPEGKEYKTIRLVEESVGDIVLMASGHLAMGGGRGLLRIGMEDEEKQKELPKLIRVVDLEGKVASKVGEPHDFKDILLNQMGNQTQFALDRNDNVYLVFLYQNRVEKISPEGKILWRADRKLNYSVEPPKDKGKIERRGGNVSVQTPQMNRCAAGAAVDGKGRVWVATLDRQPKKEEQVGMMIGMTSVGGKRTMSYKVSGDTELRKTDMFKLEIYGPDGVLLGEIPVDIFIDGIFIEGDTLFILDKMRGAQFHEYKITG